MSMLVPFFPFSSSLYAPTRNEGDNDLFPHEAYDSLLSPWFDSNVATLPKMKCDVKETDDAYEVKADIPGVDKNDLDVTYDDDHVLSISYEHDDANDKKDDDGVRVYIGDESPVESMKDCSVVTATYELGDGMQGTIGIIGPKRMDYEKVMDNLKTVKATLNQVFDGGSSPGIPEKHEESEDNGTS